MHVQTSHHIVHVQYATHKHMHMNAWIPRFIFGGRSLNFQSSLIFHQNCKIASRSLKTINVHKAINLSLPPPWPHWYIPSFPLISTDIQMHVDVLKVLSFRHIIILCYPWLVMKDKFVIIILKLMKTRSTIFQRSIGSSPSVTSLNTTSTMEEVSVCH